MLNDLKNMTWGEAGILLLGVFTIAGLLFCALALIVAMVI